jgi:hypothetical protein
LPPRSDAVGPIFSDPPQFGRIISISAKVGHLGLHLNINGFTCSRGGAHLVVGTPVALLIAARDPRSRRRLGCRYGTRRACGDRANSAGRRRASPADCDVHRPRWLDCARDQARSRGHAFSDRGPITSASLRRSPGSTASSPNTWATGCSSISAIPRRTRTMRSAPSGGTGARRSESPSCESKSLSRRASR